MNIVSAYAPFSCCKEQLEIDFHTGIKAIFVYYFVGLGELKAGVSDKWAQCVSEGKGTTQFWNNPTGNFWLIPGCLNQANIYKHQDYVLIHGPPTFLWHRPTPVTVGSFVGGT
jgi:hypothetical protein